MDGAFYNDLRAPFIVADIPAVTLATTNKALYPVANFPPLGSNYFNFPGKSIRIRLFGRMTTGATPGNLQIAVYFGTGADANGVILASSLAAALTINKTALSWCMEFDIVCRTLGAAGTLFCTGWTEFNVGLIASTLAPILIPDNTPVVSAACDLTTSGIISVQTNRSGSTAESMQVHNGSVIALN